MPVHDSSSRQTLGHIALYARDARWRRALPLSLEKAGHSCQAGGSPGELHRVLTMQRFDVLALKLRDGPEARAIARVLDEAPQPPHTVVVGAGADQLTPVDRRRGATLRYVPGPLPAQDVSRLIDMTLSAGVWDDSSGAFTGGPAFEEVEIEELIDEAAASVYRQARRKRQRFSTAVSGATTRAYGDPSALRRIFSSLLGLVVGLAPSGALVAVEAEAGGEEWVVRVSATSGNGRPARRVGHLANALQEETKTLSAVSRALKEQGGMFWVELGTPAGFACSLTLPLPPEAAQQQSA
jgi:hypothetical protein